MARALLTIDEGGKSRKAELNCEGTIIGRSPRCDIVIDSKDVSREHVRVFQDPFGRWIFEDLGSSNGTFVNGRRINACAVLPGEQVVVGPISLSISGPSDHQVEADASVQGTNIIVEDFETEIISGRGGTAQVSMKPCPDQLDAITERLSQLTNSSTLYPEVCKRLAWMPKAVAAVLRVPGKGESLPKTPNVLACHFGQSADDTIAQISSGAYPSHLAFRVSHRVLDEVRSSGEAIMAKSIYSSDIEVTVTVVDEHSPRAAICTPLGDTAETVDLLYLDIPIGGGRVSPEETFAFVAAVAEKVASVRQSLTPIHIKAERSSLDHELSLAQQIQARLAPVVPAGLAGFEAAVRYKPVIWVGGDYCDLWKMDKRRLAFAIGHIEGKGLQAAMAISELRTLLRTTMFFSSAPGAAAGHVSSHLAGSSLEGISASLFLGLLDVASGEIKYVNAGHTAPLIVHSGSRIRPLGESSDGVLGGAAASYREDTTTLPDGAAMVICSAGVGKTMSATGEQFGEKRLMHLLKTVSGRGAEKIADSVLHAVADFQKPLAQQDDITTVVFVKR
ncbi:MAG: SpoIIE family protein phosphatase [Sedimentisphaerales bacterium]|nr:SpoIIE family protein phosphatase [Sedimentisphaerales bacterium]